ncbi:MAG: dihydroneopterin aldolase [Gammaproteobacteria bacterium]|nr:dihydroneopterin aldolase [Gammaproteobacteria bacterium]MBT8151158.1 dihydroneopterin aldolase [Gammaproteobacteria bacterium]NND38241.1 dihydroneopterin aldolase [Pseudomonadales bacterium]NNL11315.1 dihydroneopterin aldolase [Pseudomonadales bacterium]NNM12027.1 dihydroneopterin aldolase [Pseudomonadales bacterium]
MATIFIEQLCVETLIGIHDWERKVPQALYFDIEAEADISAAAKSDSIDDALNYTAMAEAIEQFVYESKRLLLESLVQDLAAYLLKQFTAVQNLQITVRKPQAIAAADCAGIRVQVSRN